MRAFVVIATYSERENVRGLLDEVLRAVPAATVLVVDDDSPDGTWKVVEEKAARDSRVKLLRRIGKRGRGSAMVDGFERALAEGADALVEMDADFSHSPSHISSLLEGLNRYDVVLGSRFVAGGRDAERGWWRRLVSRFARLYLRWLFGYRVADPTSGFRAFRRDALGKIDFRSLRAKGPFAITESLSRCQRAGLRIGEVPIEFSERKGGQSKLGGGTLLRYLWQALRQAIAVRRWTP